MRHRQRPHPGAFFRYSVATGRCDRNSTDDAGPVYCGPGGSTLSLAENGKGGPNYIAWPSASKHTERRRRAAQARLKAQLQHKAPPAKPDHLSQRAGEHRQGMAPLCVRTPCGTPSREPLWGAWTTGSSARPAPCLPSARANLLSGGGCLQTALQNVLPEAPEQNKRPTQARLACLMHL